MTLLQLEYFREVARCEHITQVAEALHITQPALSKIISEIEKEMGAQLFDRMGKTIRLNDLGRVLYKYTDKIFSVLDEMNLEFNEVALGKTGQLSVAFAFPIHNPHVISSITIQFIKDHPGVRFNAFEKRLAEIRLALESRKADLAITTVDIGSTDILWEPLYSERVGVIISKNHPLAGHDIISINQLKNEHFLCPSPYLRDLTLAFCRTAGYEPVITVEGDFPLIIGEQISCCRGIALISKGSYKLGTLRHASYEFNNNVSYCDFEEEFCKEQYGIGTLRGRHYTGAAEKYIDMLKQQYRTE